MTVGTDKSHMTLFNSYMWLSHPGDSTVNYHDSHTDDQPVEEIVAFMSLSQCSVTHYKGRVKRIWYFSPMRAAKVQASLRIRTVSLEPPLLAHTSSESRGTFKLKARSLAPLNGWACAVKICHDGMLEDTNSLDTVTIKELGEASQKAPHLWFC